jgi:aerobic-type carbon monoxide dehydrogenase small subunit (CoxS/CutS family)
LTADHGRQTAPLNQAVVVCSQGKRTDATTSDYAQHQRAHASRGVLLNGEAVNSCLVLAWQAEGADILTSAGLGTVEQPHPLQAAFADTGAIQCGYCTPGLIISAKALLDHNPHPTEADIREAIEGNLCRCTGYGHIVEAIQVAAEKLSAGGAQ